MKRITEVMTPQPWTVQLDDSLAVARRMLAEREIHHLPVLDAGQVVAMVDLRQLSRADDRLGTVAEVTVPVQTMADTARLDDVLDAMVAGHSDAVVITSEGTVAGIFTATDAVRVLRDVLRAVPTRSSRPHGRRASASRRPE